MRSGRATALALLACALAAPAQGHEVRPGYLELREERAGRYQVLFKVPAKGDQRLALYLRLPAGCDESPVRARLAGGAHVERWEAACEGGLVGETVSIDGLPDTRTDVLARVVDAAGGTQTVRLTPGDPSFEVTGPASWLAVAGTYLWLGVEHILLGLDHLLFVLALLLLVGSFRRLVATVTAFTVAHSITLAAATLGLVHVSQAPVEAAIALSIVFVAAEILHAARGKPGLTERKPWLVAFAFGLLHGLGFAGALREVGLPEGAIPLALAFFNVGVEVGQLAFVAAVFALLFAAQRLAGLAGRPVPTAWALARRVARPAAYVIGILAAFWLIERTVAFWA